MRALLVACALAVVATVAVRGDSSGVVLNTASFGVTLKGDSLGHNCWSSSVGSTSDQEWTTSTSDSCVVNFDELVQKNSASNCTARFQGVFQVSPATGKEAVVAVASVVGSDDGTNLCGSTAVSAVFNSTPVLGFLSCAACGTSHPGKYSAGVVYNTGPLSIGIAAYSSIFSDSCWSGSVGHNGG